MPTAKEARAENIAKMGQELGEQYSALWQEVASLHLKWSEYVELFGTKPERIDLLNKAAPAFFRMVQDELWENILIHLARLTDPPVSVGKKRNLTILNLPNLVDQNLRKSVEDLIVISEEKTAFCRDWRNRIIAHQDLDLAMERPSRPLEQGSRRDVKEALKAITEVLNEVSGHYMDSETGFELAAMHGGALSALYVLSDGLKAGVKREERLKRGEWWADDQPAEL